MTAAGEREVGRRLAKLARGIGNSIGPVGKGNSIGRPFLGSRDMRRKY